MASKHCENCFKGAVGTDHSKLEIYAGVYSYIARPEVKATKAIFLATDAFGPELIQTQRIANAFAKEGWLCVVPDFFGGDALALDFDFKNKEAVMKWFGKHSHDTSIPIGIKTVDQLRADGLERIGVVGYCYGGKISFVLAGTDKVDCYIAAHPSTPTFPDDIENIKNLDCTFVQK